MTQPTDNALAKKSSQPNDPNVPSIAELQMMQKLAVALAASLAESRDSERGQHLKRIQEYIRVLAQKLKPLPRFSSMLTSRMIEMIVIASPLHDIGKVGLPDRVLLNPGKLSVEEFDVMKTHTSLGKEIIEKAETLVGTSFDFLSVAKEIAYSHQEKWNGTGYPQGLEGDDIPLGGRLIAVADVYDALVSPRLYRPAMSHDKAVSVIALERGQHFDPDMVDAFISVSNEFKAIYQRYPNTQADLIAYAERLAKDFAEQVEIVPVRNL